MPGGGDFPSLPDGDTTEGQIYQPVRRRDVAEGLDGVAAHFDQVGQVLGGMADKAATVEGQNQAVADIQGGGVTAKSQTTVYGQAYNSVAMQSMGEQRRAQMAQDVGTAYAANPNNPAELDKALTGIKAGYATTGFPVLDTQLDGDFALHRADALAKAQAGLHQTMVQTQAANYQSAFETGSQNLDQSAAGATFDAPGAARISAGWGNFVRSLAQYGPPTEFKVGDIDIPADPTRPGVISPEQITAHGLAAMGEAKRTWMVNAQNSLTSSDAKAKFADDLHERYTQGDPIFAGLNGQQAEALFGKLDSAASQAATDERTDQALHARNAEQQIDALQWGSPVDKDSLLKEAQASGDPGLLAKASFYANASDQIRGVLKTVVARQLGLIPDGAGNIVQPLDANGQPVGGPSRADRNNNPGNLKSLPNGEQWAGQTGVDSGGFATFANPEAGTAAAEKNLIAKQTVHGLTTLNDIIGAPGVGWAPAADGNNPGAYAAAVGKAVGVDPSKPIDLVSNPDLRHKVMSAMFAVERGGTPVTGSPANAWTPPANAQPGTPAYFAWANTKEGFTSDPVKFSVDHQVATVPPMIPQAGFSNDPAQAQPWGVAMQGRAALARNLQSGYGVPARMLSNAEVDDYKSYLQQNPAAAVPLAQNAVSALGTAGATSFLREIGQKGDEVDTPIMIANLKAWGSGIADRAALGLQLKAQGAKDPYPVTHGSTSVPDFDALQRQWGPAFQYAPSVMVAGRNVAELARLADNTAGINHDPNYYLQTSLGGSNQNGVMYGGVDTINGRPTVLPRWIAQGNGPEVLQAIGAHWQAAGGGPAFSNGQPMGPQDVRKLQPVMRSDGTYSFISPQSGRVVAGNDGHAVTFDFDQARPWLKSAVPNAVFGGR